MTRPASLASLAALLLLAAGARASVEDSARLFPAGTLAYVEIADPAGLGPEVAAAFKGTVLEDSLRSVHDRRDKTKNVRDLIATDEFGLLGLLASPEALGEFRKFRGLAAGLTHFNERNEPEVALAVLTGDSTALGLAARAYLTVNPSMRRIGFASGVPVFQYRPGSVANDPNTGQPLPANEKPATEGFAEPTYAYSPGLLVVGSSRAAVAVVVGRFLDGGKDSLAETAAFREAAARNRKPGAFWFARPRDLCERVDANNKKNGELVDGDAYALLKMLANPKAIPAASGALRFRDRGLSASVELELEAGATGPLLALLGGRGASAEALRHVPPGPTLGLSVALPAADRAAAVFGFLDALAKAGGTLGRLPSQAERDLAAKFKVAVAGSLLARTRTATVVVPTAQELPKGAVPLPLLVLHADDGATATAWAEAVRALVADLSGAEALPEPSTETIGGQKVFSLAGAGLPWKAPIHYAADGTTFAVGLDRRLVAAAVGLRGVAPAIPAGLDAQDAAALGAFSIGGWVRGWAAAPREEAEGNGPKVIDPKVIDRPIKVVGRAVLNNGQPPDPELVKQAAKAFEECLAALADLPPAVGVARRTPMRLRVEWFQPDVQGAAFAKAIDRAMAWMDRYTSATSSPNGEGGGILIER